MSRALFQPVAALALAGCASNVVPAEPLAFVGTWDCGSRTLTFTNTTYDNGTDSFPIAAVSRDGMNYTLRFADGYIMGLVAVTETGLTRVSGTPGARLNCRRVG